MRGHIKITARIWRGGRSSTSASRRWRRCATTASRPPASTRWPRTPTGSAGRPSGIEVIDADLGCRAAAEGRGRVQGAGRAGVLRRGRCRSSAWRCPGWRARRADWQRLLELCSLTDTLIVDADGIYDLADFNDRLLLGLEGHDDRGRAAHPRRPACRAQAARRRGPRRAALRRCPSATSTTTTAPSSIDPDEEVQRRGRRRVRRASSRPGRPTGWSARSPTAGSPRRAYGGAWAELALRPAHARPRADGAAPTRPTPAPTCSGAAAAAAAVDPDGTIHDQDQRCCPREQWGVVIHDHHPGYITWEQFCATSNGWPPTAPAPARARRARAARCCQGIIRCGGCGRADERPLQRAASRAMTALTAAATRSGHARLPRRHARAPSTSPVAERLLAAVAPEQIALALAAADEVADRRDPRDPRRRAARRTRPLRRRPRRTRLLASATPTTGSSPAPSKPRWEAKLRELADAEAELAAATPRQARAARARRHRSARARPRRACGPRPPPRTATANGCCAP